MRTTFFRVPWRIRCLFFIFFGLGMLLLPQTSSAAVSNWHKGVSIVPRWDRDFESGSFQQSIDALTATGANYVTLIIPYYQSNIYATDIHRGWNTPPDETLISAIRYIRSKGMQVNLKPHLDSYDGQWRANIDPGDRDGWFLAYGNMLKNYATVAAAEGVGQLTIGTELIKMADPQFNGTNTERWNRLIGEIRQIYSGNLTYSANWGAAGWTDEKNHIQFWSSLDTVGISAYFPLPSGDNSVESLKREWHRWNTQDITPLQQRTGKPIQFTEVGYRSLGGNRYEPFNFWNGGGEDQTEQANLYEALFSYWNEYAFMQGVDWWDWRSDPNAVWSGTEYTPQHKQAEAVMTRWFGNAAPPPPVQNASFSGGTVITGASPQVGTPLSLTASVTNTGGVAQGIIVDIEVYTSDNTRVHQQFFEGQSFTAGQTREFTAQWTPNRTGEYVVRVGVFNNNWTVNYLWNHTAVSFRVGGDTPPPAQDQTVEIWWPTAGAQVSGVQPLKAIVPGRDLGSYSMFWQVDGDRLNDMFNSNEDFPHKEALIDMSSWRWQGSGPYTVTVVAQDGSGSAIAERSIQVFVY